MRPITLFLLGALALAGVAHVLLGGEGDPPVLQPPAAGSDVDPLPPDAGPQRPPSPLLGGSLFSGDGGFIGGIRSGDGGDFSSLGIGLRRSSDPELNTGGSAPDAP